MAHKYIVRYGMMRHLGEFSAKKSDPFTRDDEVIVKTNRGVEFGNVLCEATVATAEYLGLTEPSGRILRKASIDDQQQRNVVHAKEADDFRIGERLIQEHKLKMTLVDVERLHGEDRLIFYFLSESRVDFRQLVKSLAKEFQVRIEMRQIGIRDEAKLLADYGDCGKPVCCNTHLKEMPPVSMKMAKVQKATLDPAKISGRCGRLKCCLRYEYDTYQEYRKSLPTPGTAVVTKEGQGKVLAQEVLARQLVVELEDGRRLMMREDDILTTIKRKAGRKALDESTDGETKEQREAPPENNANNEEPSSDS